MFTGTIRLIDMTRWLAIFSASLLIALLTYVGPADYADALTVEADMKLMRVQVASRSEHITTPAAQSYSDAPPISTAPGLDSSAFAGSIFPLTHPLSCDGIWIRKCADWQPCSEHCLEER